MTDLRKAAEIKTWQQRCEEHPDHDGIVTEQMIRDRMQEEIDELRQALAQPDLAKVGEVGVWGEKEANRSQATTSAFISNHKPVAYEVGADVINSQGQFEYRTFLAYRPDPAMTTGGHEVAKVLEARPLYTAPPKQEWDGPTDKERFSRDWQETVARAEAKLKEKNT